MERNKTPVRTLSSRKAGKPGKPGKLYSSKKKRDKRRISRVQCAVLLLWTPEIFLASIHYGKYVNIVF